MKRFKARTAIKKNDNRMSADIIAAFVSLHGWEWFATEVVDREEGIYYGLVQSPMMPEGEWGTFSLNEIKPYVHGATSPEGILPPEGYAWKDEVLVS